MKPRSDWYAGLPARNRAGTRASRPAPVTALRGNADVDVRAPWYASLQARNRVGTRPSRPAPSAAPRRNADVDVRVPWYAGLPARNPVGVGYTLVELMVVLVILGLLIGLVAPNFFGRSEKAHVDAAHIQMRSLYGALQTYRLDIGRYPTTSQGLAALIEAPGEVADYWHGPYLDADAVPHDPWKAPYRYEQPADTRHGFALYSLGADGATGGEDYDADIGYLPEQRSAQAQ